MAITLTPEQQQAAIGLDGFWCVLASAGSGKTSTFVERIANMIKSGIKPYNILALTFTNKAAEEMQKRLAKMVGDTNANAVTISTFHSFAYRLLMAHDIEVCKSKIAPDWWVMQKLNDLCKKKDDKNHLGLDLGIRAGELSTFISYQKANLVSPKDPFVITDTVAFVKGVKEELLRQAYTTFEQLKTESRQLTFDDMLVLFYNKLVSDVEFTAEIKKKFHYILVDEFQDTSTLMLKIIEIINDTNIFVVGDWRQSIFSFINANVENILDFPEKFSGTTQVDLNKNFRSTQNIVNFSNRIIDLSPIEKYKQYRPSESVAEVGDKVTLTAYLTEKSQAEAIAKKIVALEDKGVPLSEIAILVRSNSMTAVFEEVLSDQEIPYEVTKSVSFFDRREILDILSYARIAIDPDDNPSFRRIYNSPNRYLSKQFLEELERFAGSKNMNLMQAIRLTPQAHEWKFRKGIESVVSVIEDLRDQVNLNAAKFLKNVVQATGYMRHISENASSATTLNESIESIEKLYQMAVKFKSIRDFLAYVYNITEKKKKKKAKEAVQISTMHSAKGLEWLVCFVVNVSKELLPHKMNPLIEEERRLLYVACSRPKKKLFVSWYLAEPDGERLEESQFINELLGEFTVTSMRDKVLSGSSEESVLVGE